MIATIVSIEFKRLGALVYGISKLILIFFIKFFLFKFDFESFKKKVFFDFKVENKLRLSYSGDEFLKVGFNRRRESIKEDKRFIFIIRRVKFISEMILYHRIGNFFNLIFFCGKFSFKFF